MWTDTRYTKDILGNRIQIKDKHNYLTLSISSNGQMYLSGNVWYVIFVCLVWAHKEV